MERFAVGDIVLLNFPFSDLRQQKPRPALVVAKAEFNDLIVCQITSNPYTSKRVVEVAGPNFTHGSLPVKSYVRPDKLFTLSQMLPVKKMASLSQEKQKEVFRRLHALFPQRVALLVDRQGLFGRS